MKFNNFFFVNAHYSTSDSIFIRPRKSSWSPTNTATDNKQDISSDVVESHFAVADEKVAVEEVRLDDDVPVEHLGRHHLRLGGSFYQTLPRVG